MRKRVYVLLLTLSSLCPLFGFQLLQDGYVLQPHAQYNSPTSCGRLEFDGGGNLYVSHYDDGKIMKINQNGQVSTLASGLGNVYSLTWGGGSVYGDYLYVTSRTPNFTNDRILKVDMAGNSSYFASMVFPRQAPTFVEIDKTGNYGGLMYTSGTGQDRLYSVASNGSVSLFADWPSHVGGGIYAAGFDPTGKYGNQLFLCTIIDAPGPSGLYVINPNATVSKFSNDLVSALIIDFDAVGTYFDNYMFVAGQGLDGQGYVFRVAPDGTATEFMRDVSSFAFGADGALYVSYYNWGTHDVTIARVIPEPATLLLLAAGALLCRRRA